MGGRERSQEKGHKTLTWVERGLHWIFIVNPRILWKWKIEFSVLQDGVPTPAFKCRPISSTAEVQKTNPFGFWPEAWSELHNALRFIFRQKTTWNQNMLFPWQHWWSCNSMGGFGDWSFGRREALCTKPKGGPILLLLLIYFFKEREKCQSMEGRVQLLGVGLKDCSRWNLSYTHYFLLKKQTHH